MNHLQWYDWFRLATAAIAFWSMFRFTQVIRHRRAQGQSYSTRLIDFVWLIFAYMFTQMLGGLESVLINGPYKYTIFLSFLTALVAFRATRMFDDELIT